jgi:ribonuclease HII
MYVIGIDEVGRGPIAGPMVVCACAIKDGIDALSLFPKGELRDSKKLTDRMREKIVKDASVFLAAGDIIIGIGEVDAERIDTTGLSSALKEALTKALEAVHAQNVPTESFIFLDGSLHVDNRYAQETVIKGDEKIVEIALASIFAKVHRDAYMKEMTKIYKGYGFERHVGYGTAEHYEAIKKYGTTPLHRRSFLKNFTNP